MDKNKGVIKLRKKALARGRKSLYLDIWYDGKRSYEFLKLYLVEETNAHERSLNRRNLALAEDIRAKRQLELKNREYGFKPEYKLNANYIDYFRKLTDDRVDSSNNYGNWRSASKHLINCFGDFVKFKEVDVKFCEDFKHYLENKAKSKNGKPLAKNTQHSYFNKFRASLNKAHKEGLIPENPIKAVTGVKSETPSREYLTVGELKALSATECKVPILKKAFLFCCLTGLRWSDATNLKWKDLFKEDQCYRIKFRQKKTGGLEYLDINDQAVGLLGKRGGKEEKVFRGLKYSTHNNSVLVNWVAKAGIQKDITFHCSRHTFAVIQLEMGTPIYTVSKLLGHQHLKTTEVYARIVDKKKREAMMNMPNILDFPT